jgi:gas vesicle protein
MSSRSRSARAAGLGALAGTAAGFALGLLLAPDEGRQLRRRVAYLLDRWADDLSGVVRRLESDDSAATSVARAKADALVADARVQAQALLTEADALIDEARQRRADSAS